MHIRFNATGAALPAIVLAAALAGTPAANAQEASGSVSLNLLSVDGLVVGSTLKIDADYAAEHGIEVPAPFSVLIPTADGLLELIEKAPEDSTAFFKMNFATEDLELIENIQFVPFTVEMDDHEVRMLVTAQVMSRAAFDAATAGYAERSLVGVRETTAGDLPAVEVVGTYQDPQLGLIYLRIVGIPNPNGPESVFAVANVVASREPLPSPDDFPRTRGGAAIRHFEYLE